MSPSVQGNRTHQNIRNDVSGIGLPLSDNSRAFGSAGRLRGYTRFPIPASGLSDGADFGYQHEIGHQWINYLPLSPFDGGAPHWPVSTLASGIMGWGTAQGLEFPCDVVSEPTGIRLVPRRGAATFKDLDLYMMGMLSPDEVGEHLVFTDQRQASGWNCIQNPNQVVDAGVVRVGVKDIVGRLGTRVPDWRTAPKVFRIATVLVTKDDLASADEMAYYAWFAKRAAEQREVAIHTGLVRGTGKPFFVSTGGRGELNSLIARAKADFDVTPQPQTLTVRSTEAAVYAVTVAPEFSAFEGDVALSCSNLPSPNVGCAFSPETLVPGATGETATLTVSAAAGFQLPRGNLSFSIHADSESLQRQATAFLRVQ